MSSDSIPGTMKKRRNNIWGSVLTEQTLSQDIKQFGVKKDTFSDGYRGVESYDFTAAKDDDRPDLGQEEIPDAKEEIFGEVVDLEKEVKKHESRKRKKNAKERLGKRGYDMYKPRTFSVPESDETADIVKAITDALEETNIELFSKLFLSYMVELSFYIFYNCT